MYESEVVLTRASQCNSDGMDTCQAKIGSEATDCTTGFYRGHNDEASCLYTVTGARRNCEWTSGNQASDCTSADDVAWAQSKLLEAQNSKQQVW